jgi:hypothetical protein
LTAKVTPLTKAAQGQRLFVVFIILRRSAGIQRDHSQEKFSVPENGDLLRPHTKDSGAIQVIQGIDRAFRVLFLDLHLLE